MNGLLPQWAKVVGIVGFPTVVALYFMAQMGGFIGSPALAAKEVTERMESSLIQHSKDAEMSNSRLLTALKVLCENAAKDRAAINNCQNIK